jgi:hypothetical protein
MKWQWQEQWQWHEQWQEQWLWHEQYVPIDMHFAHVRMDFDLPLI